MFEMQKKVLTEFQNILENERYLQSQFNIKSRHMNYKI